MKMRKILFITSSRADYGTLRNVILETQKRNKETYLLVTGSHTFHLNLGIQSRN